MAMTPGVRCRVSAHGDGNDKTRSWRRSDYNKNRHEEARKRMTGHHERGKCENTMTDKPNERPITEKPGVRIEIHAAPKGEWKALGGSNRDQWNERLSDLVIGALPVNQTNTETVSHAGSAVAAGIVDIKPADPVEGMLISQLVVANEAALKLYQLAWLNSGLRKSSLVECRCWDLYALLIILKVLQ
jgi:hypothetical protein